MLHILAGVSIGISMAMAPTPDKVGTSSLLVLVALAALLDGLIARRAARNKAQEEGMSHKEHFIAYPLLVICLFAFFFIVRNLAQGALYLWISCSVFAVAVYLWRDCDYLRPALTGDEEGWSRKRLLASSFGLAPAAYYAVYGALGMTATSFWAASAAIFHTIVLASRRLIDGPLRKLVLEPNERAIEALLQDVQAVTFLTSKKDALSSETPDAPVKGVKAEASSKEAQSEKVSQEAKEALARRLAPTKKLPAEIKVQAEPDATAPLEGPLVDKLGQGLEAWEQGNEAKALECFLEVVQKRPDVEEPTIWAVQLVSRQGMSQMARDLLIEFLRRVPTSYVGFFRLGQLMAEANKNKLAHRAFKKAALINNKAAAPWREMARLSAARNENTRALRLAHEVLRRDGNDRWALDFVEEVERLEKRRKVTSLREEARTLLASRKRGEALAVFKELAGVDPRDTEARLVSARVLLDTGDPDEAVSIFEQALSMPFEGREGHELPVELARAYLEKGDVERALDELSRSRAHFPLHLDLGMLHIDGLLRSGQKKEIGKEVELARQKLAPAEQLLLGSYAVLQGEAYGLYERERVDELLADFLERAKTLGKPAAGYEVKERFLARLHEMEGTLHSRCSRIDESIISFEEALGFDPRSIVARKALAKARLLKEQPARAVIHLENLQRLEPKTLGWRRSMLQALYAEAKGKDELEAYFASILLAKRQALLEEPGSPSALFDLGVALTVFERDVSAEQGGCGALHYLRLALQKEPLNHWHLLAIKDYLLSPISKGAGWQEAERLLAKSVQKEGAQALLHLEYAELLMAKPGGGSTDKARVHFVKALKLAPTLGEAHYGLGKLAVIEDDLEKARDHFAKGLRLAPFDKGAQEAKKMVG